MCAAWSGREPAQEVSATTKNPGSQGRPGKWSQTLLLCFSAHPYTYLLVTTGGPDSGPVCSLYTD